MTRPWKVMGAQSMAQAMRRERLLRDTQSIIIVGTKRFMRLRIERKSSGTKISSWTTDKDKQEVDGVIFCLFLVVMK